MKEEEVEIFPHLYIMCHWHCCAYKVRSWRRLKMRSWRRKLVKCHCQCCAYKVGNGMPLPKFTSFMLLTVTNCFDFVARGSLRLLLILLRRVPAKDAKVYVADNLTNFMLLTETYWFDFVAEGASKGCQSSLILCCKGCQSSLILCCWQFIDSE